MKLIARALFASTVAVLVKLLGIDVEMITLSFVIFTFFYIGAKRDQ